MAINRYTDITPSSYTPQSMEELAFVPLMKRQKHDANQAKLEGYLSEINKIDPLDVHTTEAMQIKSDLSKSINTQAEQLAREGFNHNTVPNVLKTNREIQDLFSPTGRAGQINAAKVAEAAAYKRFLESDDAKSNSQEVNLANWKKHRSTENYSGYDENKNITNITDLGAVKYIDPNKFVDELATHAGFNSETKSDAFASLIDTGNTNGTRYTINTKEAHKRGSNTKQLQSLANLMNNLQNDVTSPLRKSIEYTGRNINEVSKQISSQLGIYHKTEKEDAKEFGYGNVDYAKNDGTDTKSMFNDAIQDPSSIQNLDKDIQDVNFNEIGTINQNNYPIDPKDTAANQTFMREQNAKRGKINTYKDVLNPLQQQFYKAASRKLIASGKISKEANLNDPKVSSLIGNYMKTNMKFPTLANDIIRADIAIDNKLFTGALASKNQTERNNVLEQDLKGKNPLRTMVDVKTGKKLEFEEGDKIDYLGVDSPINYRNYNFNNGRMQSVMAHRAHLLDKDNNVKGNVVVSRSPNEMNDQNFKNMHDVNQVYKNAVEHLGEWQRPTGKYSGNKNLNKIKVKVNDDNTFEIQPDGYPSSGKLSNEQFLIEMDRHFNKQ